MRFDFLIPILNADLDIAFYGAVARELEERGLSVGVVANHRREVEPLRSQFRHVFYVYEGVDLNRPVTASEVAEIEARFGLTSMADHVYPEKTYDWAEQGEGLVRRAVHTFRFLERLLAEHSVGCFLNNLGGELLRRSMARISDRGGPGNLIIDFAPFRGRFALNTDEAGTPAVPRDLPALSSDQRDFIQTLVDQVTRERKPFAHLSTLGLSSSSFGNALRVWRTVRRDPERDVVFERLVAERVRRLARRIGANPLYEQPRPGERFLFLPLHVINDSAITIRAPQYEQQEFLVDYIARRALPTDTVLYVKPHIGARDVYPLPMLYKIRQTPRVRLIHPGVNPHSLITSAEAVIVINSTVGFEAITHARPVVVVGRPFYRGFGVTVDVDNLTDLSQAVRRALREPPDRERILRFLHAYYQSTWPGQFWDSSEANARLICDAVIARARSLGHLDHSAEPARAASA